MVEVGFGMDPLLLAGGQVVDDRHLMTSLQEGINDVGSDETGTAGNKYFHGVLLLWLTS